jgi:hypothetical protein
MAKNVNVGELLPIVFLHVELEAAKRLDSNLGFTLVDLVDNVVRQNGQLPLKIIPVECVNVSLDQKPSGAVTAHYQNPTENLRPI